MATEQQKLMFKRRAASQVAVPVLEMPKIPDVFKSDPKYREGWAEYERNLDAWRKTLGGIVSGGGGGVGGSQSTTIVNNTTVVQGEATSTEDVEDRIMDWIM